MFDANTAFKIVLVISLVFLGGIFLTFTLKKSVRSYAHWQVIFLSISTFLSTFSYLLYTPTRQDEKTPSPLCSLQSFTMVWFDMSIYMCATLIIYSIYYHTIHFDLIKSDSIPFNWWIGDFIFGYLFPFAYATLLYSFNLLGPNGDYCWILPNKRSLYYDAALITYIIAWLFILTNICLSFKVIYFIRKLPQEEKDYVKDYAWNLLLFPIIQFIVTLPGSVNRILVIVGTEASVWGDISKFCFATMGILVAIAFGKNMHVFEKILPCCFKETERPSEPKANDLDNQAYNVNLRSSILDEQISF